MLDACIEKYAATIDRGTAFRAGRRIADCRDFSDAGNTVRACATSSAGRDRVRGALISPLNGLAFPEMPSILFNLQS